MPDPDKSSSAPAREAPPSRPADARQPGEDLDRVKRQPRDTAGLYVASHKEMKAAQGEMEAMSEELEKSRKELQSRNEELAAVNQELKHKVEELSRTNSDLQNLMAATPIATLFLDRELRIKRYTPAAGSLFNLIPADVGRTLSDLSHRLDYQTLATDAEAVLDRLAPLEREVRHADGRCFIARMVPYRNQIAGVVLTLVDITERTRAEEDLRRSEEQFRRAIELAPLPVIMQAENGQVLQISRTWTQLAGDEPKEVSTFETWLGRVSKGGADDLRHLVRTLFTGRAKMGQVEIEITTRSGEARNWIFSASAPGTLRDGSRFIVGMAIDFTDQRTGRAALDLSAQHYERLRSIVENARDYAIFSTDMERRITSWNPGAERVLGYSEAEMLGQPIDVIFTPEDRSAGAVEREIHGALETGHAQDERWHLRKDGSRFWGNGTIMATNDASGRIVGFAKILHDQTDARKSREILEQNRRELLEALQENERARAEAEAAGRAKDHFLAVLSHELRTPLTPILINVETLALIPDLPASAAEPLETIRRSVASEARLIDDLLDTTRIVRGKFEIACQPVNIHEVIRHAVEVTHAEVQGRQQKLTLRLDATQPSLTGDAERLQQAIWNLLQNASKFTPATGGIRVTTRNANGRLLIAVADDGAGIDPQVLPTIFDAFTQGSQAIARQFGGLGLGLAICKAVVEAHGGTIRAESPGPGGGATFTIDLPSPKSALLS